jgi:hypothetical protein
MTQRRIAETTSACTDKKSKVNIVSTSNRGVPRYIGLRGPTTNDTFVIPSSGARRATLIEGQCHDTSGFA